MSIDVPNNMSDLQANNISNRLCIVDRLINTQGTSLNNLFKEGLGIEDHIRASNPNYVSQLDEKISRFKDLNALYKH